MPHNGRFVSEVPRVAGTRFVQVREDLITIIRQSSKKPSTHARDTGAAALLDQLIYFADLADWQPFEKSFPVLEEAIMSMRCHKTIREHILPDLEQLGFISYQQDQGQETVITVNLEAINEALSKSYPSQPQLRKNFQSTQEELPEHSGKTSGVGSGPSLLGSSKDLKDSSDARAREADSQKSTPNDAEIVSFLQDQALQHGVKIRFTGKQKDWLRENEDVGVSEGFRKLALAIMAIHRGRRINVTEAIMAAVGYSVGRSAGPSRGPGDRRQFTPRIPKPKTKPPGYDFEAKLLADGKISQQEWDELRAQD